jgi:hypothetical protein
MLALSSLVVMTQAAGGVDADFTQQVEARGVSADRFVGAAERVLSRVDQREGDVHLPEDVGRVAADPAVPMR